MHQVVSMCTVTDPREEGSVCASGCEVLHDSAGAAQAQSGRESQRVRQSTPLLPTNYSLCHRHLYSTIILSPSGSRCCHKSVRCSHERVCHLPACLLYTFDSLFIILPHSFFHVSFVKSRPSVVCWCWCVVPAAQLERQVNRNTRDYFYTASRNSFLLVQIIESYFYMWIFYISRSLFPTVFRQRRRVLSKNLRQSLNRSCKNQT